MPSPATGGRPRILVTGGTGFVGSAVLRVLRERCRALTAASRPEIRVLTRRPLPPELVAAGVVEVRGDLADPATLRGACDDVSTVLHLAAQVGGDAGRCVAVNERGTEALLHRAAAAGVGRLVYLSTTGVYGSGVHRGAGEDDLPMAPVSATSRSRAAAEVAVRESGGIVLRPHLVYGPGDTWFVPTVLGLFDRVPAWIDGGAARASLVRVEDLGAVGAALALGAGAGAGGGVFHVNHPEPVSVRTLVTSICARLGRPAPRDDLPARRHRELTRRALPGLTDHQFELLAEDHYYESSRIWRWTGVPAGAGFAAHVAEAADWYGRATAPAPAADTASLARTSRPR
ncbi:NAD-dependent epimerase/dehydratase family protein [Couchioplanes azureus]|uniref:NAD-dependent epimerase/dehydratase family protein n=1 Tax=Couchioplanes caeruleus TaxID=56438 RepID=UPI001670B669|nr:NAD(P)-dependent oxidoreductase [Couchioplanes caeruleus]GGQ76148.1 hypothetical protein GCM10010166_52930 [Couchioplanes caeruleus subsp. azureus]